MTYPSVCDRAASVVLLTITESSSVHVLLLAINIYIYTDIYLIQYKLRDIFLKYKMFFAAKCHYHLCIQGLYNLKVNLLIS